jgi:hypothetical protein
LRGKSISLSRPRRFIGDLLHFAAQIPTVPTQRRMQLGALVEARRALAQRPPWSALFMKAFAQVSETIPELRRAFVKFPWPHLYEYPLSVGSIAVQRNYQGEMAVFFGRIKDPARMSLTELSQRILSFREGEFEQHKAFVQAIWLSGLPSPIRRLAWWIGLNIGRQRSNFFGTFGISVYSSLGAESLHPLSPLTTTINYGVIAPDGTLNVRIVYDHRVMDGATVALALERLETQMNGSILSELRALASEIRLAA